MENKWRNYLHRVKNAKGGMTLVEVIVAVTIFSIAALLLYTGFSANFFIIGRGAANQSSGEAISTYIDTGVAAAGLTMEQDKGEITFEINGNYQELPGVYETITEPAASEMVYTVFHYVKKE